MVLPHGEDTTDLIQLSSPVGKESRIHEKIRIAIKILSPICVDRAQTLHKMSSKSIHNFWVIQLTKICWPQNIISHSSAEITSNDSCCPSVRNRFYFNCSVYISAETSWFRDSETVPWCALTSPSVNARLTKLDTAINQQQRNGASRPAACVLRRN